MDSTECDLAGMELVSCLSEGGITYTRYTDGERDYEVAWSVEEQREVSFKAISPPRKEKARGLHDE
jgi:hypothetical protein